MDKRVSKGERIAAITKILTENPNQVITLNQFSELLQCAKSTLSEDIDVIEKVLSQLNLGEVGSIAGAAGGVYYSPKITLDQIKEICHTLCEKINKEDRIIPGGYVYMNDIFYTPSLLREIGKALVYPFLDNEIDYVVTIETKGIPLAVVVANMINKPMVVVRKSARLTEGTTIMMNYLTGSSRRINKMALPKRSIPKRSKVLFIDDFMKAGGTAKGVMDLMKEFEAEVVGIGVVMVTKDPNKKLINNYYALLELDEVDEEQRRISIYPRMNGV